MNSNLLDKQLVYDKNFTEQDSIMWQLRFIYPKVSWSDLKKLYWVWKTPYFLDAWIKQGLTKNINSAITFEQRLLEMDLLEVSDEILEPQRESQKDKRGKKAKVKKLLTPIRNILTNESLSVVFNFNVISND